MIEWLGIGHLFELTRTEAIAGYFTPLVIFAVFFLVQLILPGRRVPGYVINPETGTGNRVLQRTYRCEDVHVRRRRDDVVAQRPVRGGLPLRAIR